MEFEILDNSETYVNLINLYRRCKSLINLPSNYNYLKITEEEEKLSGKTLNKNLELTALLISCGYSISMLGGDPDILKPSKTR